MQRFLSLLDGAIKLVGSAMIAAILGITLLQVIMRYGFSVALPWSADAAQILLVYTVMLVSGYAVGKASHFSLPILVDMAPLLFRRLAPKLHHALILAFAATTLFHGVKFALKQMSTTLPALGVPVGFVYLALPVGAVVMALYSVVGLLARAETGSEPGKS